MDPLSQNIQDPGLQPTPSVSSTPVSEELSQEEMTQNLKEMMEKIQSKYSEFGAQDFSTKNKQKVLEGQALREIFNLLQSMGVDPSNVEEVGAFLNKIKETNPELSKQIEESLQALLGEEQSTSQEDETDSSNMNINDYALPQENI